MAWPCRSQIAKIEYAHEDPIIWRRNRDMAITVRATSSTASGARRHQSDLAKLQEIRDSLPPAYRIEAGGAFEESAKGNASTSCCFR